MADKCRHDLLRQNGPRTFGDEAIRLGPTVLGKVENGVLVDAAHIQVAFRGDDLILDGHGLRHDLARAGMGRVALDDDRATGSKRCREQFAQLSKGLVDQTIREGEKPARTRQWRLHEVAPGRFEGTLSDAISPVTGYTQGNLLVVEFTIKGSFKVRQELTLSPDGQRAHNVTRISQLGVTAAVLVEDIVRE